MPGPIQSIPTAAISSSQHNQAIHNTDNLFVAIFKAIYHFIRGPSDQELVQKYTKEITNLAKEHSACFTNGELTNPEGSKQITKKAIEKFHNLRNMLTRDGQAKLNIHLVPDVRGALRMQICMLEPASDEEAA